MAEYDRTMGQCDRLRQSMMDHGRAMIDPWLSHDRAMAEYGRTIGQCDRLRQSMTEP